MSVRFKTENQEEKQEEAVIAVSFEADSFGESGRGVFVTLNGKVLLEISEDGVRAYDDACRELEKTGIANTGGSCCKIAMV